jgi:hypothetical protein
MCVAIAGVGLWTWLARDDQVVAIALLGYALLFLFIQSRRELIIRDEGNALTWSLHCGPVEILGERLPYASIKAITKGRTWVTLGGGFRYVHSQRWVWAGTFECVKVRGGWFSGYNFITDDVQGFLEFLQTKVPSAVR